MDHLKLKIESGSYQSNSASFKIGNRAVIIAIFVSTAVIAFFVDRMHARYSSAPNHTVPATEQHPVPNVEPNTHPPAYPPKEKPLPKQSRLPSRVTPLRDLGPISQIAEAKAELETVVAKELPRAPPPQPVTPPFDRVGSALANPHGNGAHKNHAEDAWRPSIMTIPEIHIHQSAAAVPPPVRRPKRSVPPPRQHAGPDFFEFLWGPRHRRSAQAPRVFGWRGIGSKPLPDEHYLWPWEDNTWSTLAPDTMPRAMTPGDETRCKMGSCY